MIGRRMANIIKRFARYRDDMRLANFQRMSGLHAECPSWTGVHDNRLARAAEPRGQYVASAPRPFNS